jgi:tRNA-specific 2-thiouridylase
MNKKKVLVAMSGGVDSSVTAALLKDRGFEVIGITMQIWERPGDWGGCCGLGGVEDAKRVSNKLGIPHYVLNFRDIFREKVIADFCEEYKEGRTPNPCIRCNQYIKFDALLKKAEELSADYIATGHYARIGYDNQRKRYLLRKGVDSRKDQSYVLYAMTQEQLKRTLMPLGNLVKDRVRKIAREKDLSVADKPESQEICFIPGNNYGEFLKEHIPEGARPGLFVNKEGKVIGEHQGIIFYTVGQRKGIGMAAKEPLYVIGIDKENNTIIIGKKEEAYGNELIAHNLNFIDRERLKAPLKVEAKIRYLQQASSATAIPLEEEKFKLKFDQPQWAITPGQAVVFYLPAGKDGHDKDIVVGGGTIISREGR